MLPLVYILFTLSGFVGLCYESLWAQYLKLFLGHSSYGQVLTICIYMGGLGIGSFIGSRVASQMRNPFALYALIEVGIGLGGLFYHDLYLGVTDLFYAVIPSLPTIPVLITALKLFLSLLITLPVALLLGMTFPAIAIGVMRLAGDGGKKTLGRLYFVNSIGAAAGILVCSFFFIPSFGLPGALIVAAFGNFAVAAGFFLVSRRRRAALGPSDGGGITHPNVDASLGTPRGIALLLAVAALTGLSSFVYEIGWIRLLGMMFGSSTHSFDIMISAFILGLAFGAFFVGRIIARSRSVIGTLVQVQLFMGMTATLSIFLYKPLFLLMDQWHTLFQRTGEAYAVFAVFKYLVAVLLMCPTSFFAGMTLPIITYALSAASGREVYTGRVYGWNTVGAIVGAVVGGVFLLPLLQLKNTIVFGAIVDITIAIGLLFLYPSTKSRRIIFSVAAVVVLLPTQLITFDSALLASGVFRDALKKPENRVAVTLRDGRTASISFHETIKDSIRACSIRTNGKPDASFVFGAKKQQGDMATQSALAYLPIAMIDSSYTAAIIGMGSGMTAHSLLGDSRLRSLDILEIEPEMVRLARGFLPANQRAYEDDRSHIIIDDAKTYFQNRHCRYDLIVSEPSNPWVSGVASLFSQEFYAQLRGHLNDRGIMVQWLHQYEFNDNLLLSIVAAMQSIFPSVQIYSPPAEGADILIVASMVSPSPPLAARLLAQPGIVADLKRSGLDYTLDEFVDGRYLLSSSALKMLTALVPPNSDFFPVVDNGAERAFFLKSRVELLAPFYAPGPQNPLWLFDSARAAANERPRALRREKMLVDAGPNDSLLLQTINAIRSPRADWDYLENAFIRFCGFTYDTTLWNLDVVHAYEACVRTYGPGEKRLKTFVALSSCRRDSAAIRMSVYEVSRRMPPNTLQPEIAIMLLAGCLSIGRADLAAGVFERYVADNKGVSAGEKMVWSLLCRQAVSGSLALKK